MLRQEESVVKCRLAIYYRIPGHTGDWSLPSLSPPVVTWPVVDSCTSAGQEIFPADSLESSQHPGGSIWPWQCDDSAGRFPLHHITAPLSTAVQLHTDLAGDSWS